MMEPTETFPQALQSATRNLQLAYKYRVPVIIFVIYDDETVHAEFEQQLVAQIAPQRVRRIRFYPDDPPEAAGLLFTRLGLNPPASDEVVFIYDVRHAFNRLFNSLNYQREQIAEGRWRLLFWTSEEEMIAIMRNAPHFWAFVNTSIDLSPGRQEEQQDGFVDDLAGKHLEWEDTWQDYTSEERQARIRLREYFLAYLPAEKYFTATRQYYHYMVGILYLYEQQLERAEEHLQKALKFALLMEDKTKQAQSLNRLANLYDDLAKHDQAISSYQRAIALDSTYAPAHYNLAKAYQKRKRYQEAIAAYQRAVALVA